MSPNSNILEMERTVLATLMLKPGNCHGIELVPEHFLGEQHADLYRVIRTLDANSKPVDPLTVSDYIEQQGRKPLANLAMDIANDAMYTVVPEVYAHRILTAWRQRKAREIGMTLVESTDEAAVDLAIEALMDLHVTEQNHEWDSKQAMRSAFTELSRIHEAGGKLPGITTGLSALDDSLGGFHGGDMIVVGARAAMGKTAFLGGLATAAANAGHPVGVISGEQPVKQMAMRMLSAGSKIDAKKFRTAQFDETEWGRLYQSVALSAELPIWFLDRSAPTMAEVIRVARRWKNKHGIKALYVDYLQRITGDGDRRYEQVSYVARGLKNLARSLDIPVIVLAQVSRAVESRASQVPRMGDLSDSSEIEKEADQVLMLFRPGYYNPDEPQDVARVIVEKNRHGSTGYIDLQWNGPTMTFSDKRVDSVFGESK